MSDKPHFPSTLAILAGLGFGHASRFPDRTCSICRKPIESGSAYRDAKGIGCIHPECDPREKKPVES